jgi:fumarylacetoacetase
MTTIIDETHDRARVSWVTSANDHREFPIQNLPFGIFVPNHGAPRGGVAIGDYIVDLKAATEAGLFSGAAAIAAHAASGVTLNPLLALCPSARRALRRRLSKLLQASSVERRSVERTLHRAEDCASLLPVAIGDYTDFYAGIHHALNVGRQFRPDNPLLPNYKFVPIGYHGRASSVRASGSDIIRPKGQRKGPDGRSPVFGPTERLDFELELGVWIGHGNTLGEPIPIAEADNRVVGLCLLNDWSARDFQAWEYQPLGPFLAKNFMTTISPWIVTAEALAPFRVAQQSRPDEDPPPLPYLLDDGDQKAGAYAIELEVFIVTKRMREAGLTPHRLSRGDAKHLYWTLAQLVTHHASNGCNLNPGDLLGTGTISGPVQESLGSLLEISDGGQHPLTLLSGETRTFLQDGDEVILTAHASAPGRVSIGFGDCRGIVRGVTGEC